MSVTNTVIFTTSPRLAPSGFEDAAHVLEDAAALSADVVRPDEVAVLVER